jgi:adenylate cyclase
VIPKGAETPLKIYEVGGIGTPYHLALDKKHTPLVALGKNVPLRYNTLDGKNVGKRLLKGFVLSLSGNEAEIELAEPLALLTNIKMNLKNVSEELASRGFYGKVMKQSDDVQHGYVVRFTSASPEISAYFQALRQYAGRVESVE